MGNMLTLSESGCRMYWNISVSLKLFPNKVPFKVYCPIFGFRGKSGQEEGRRRKGRRF